MNILSFFIRRFNPELFWYFYKKGARGGVFLRYIRRFT